MAQPEPTMMHTSSTFRSDLSVTARPRGVYFAVFAACVALVGLAGVASPAFAAKAKLPAGRCVDVGKADTKRVGDPWLQLSSEPLGRTPPTDFRVATLQLRLLDERTMKIRTIDVPIAKLRAGFAGAMAGVAVERTNPKGAKLDGFRVDALHVSDDGATVVLILDVNLPGGGTSRGLVIWDQRKGDQGAETVRVVPGVQTLAAKERGYLIVAGVDASGGLLLLDVRPTAAEGTTRKVALALRRIDLVAASSKTVWSLVTPARRNPGLSIGRHLRLSRDRSVLVIPEYLEDPAGEAEVHVVRLADGSHRSLPTPATTYGVDISPDGKTLALGSGRAGQVELWDLASGKKTASGKAVKRLHKLVYSKDGAMIWVAGKGGALVALDAATLRAKGQFSAKAIFGGAGALYAELPAAPSGADQPLGLVSDRYGFGDVERVCVLPL